MRKIMKYPIFVVLPICLIMILCWYLFVPSLEDALPIVILEEGIDTIELGEGITLRVDLIVPMEGYHSEDFIDIYTHFMLLDSNGKEYNIPDISAQLTDSDLGGSYVAEIDGKIIIALTAFDTIEEASDSLGSEVIFVDDRIYTAPSRYIGTSGAYGGAMRVTQSYTQFIVLENLPSDYVLTSGDLTITAQDIEDCLAEIRR